jgi:hypothetical protein
MPQLPCNVHVLTSLYSSVLSSIIQTVICRILVSEGAANHFITSYGAQDPLLSVPLTFHLRIYGEIVCALLSAGPSIRDLV